MADGRAIWNGAALVATLALAAVVAVVAVTRSQPKAPAASPTSSESPTPAGSGSPPGLAGTGPYVVYATGAGVFAYDVASGSTTSLGPLDGTPAGERPRQPGDGRLVAFPTTDGSIWTVTRRGLDRVGAIPPVDGDRFAGAVPSPDGGRLAVGVLAPDPSLVLVDLTGGGSTVIARKPKSPYPPEPLLPVAWSLGGSVIYQIPFCQCGGGSTGLYSIDTNSGTSTLVAGTHGTTFFRFVVTASAQMLFYGSGTPRRCRATEPSPCEGPPFSLRTLAAGHRGPMELKRATDARFVPSAVSPDGALLLVERIDASTGATRVELYGTDGRLEPGIGGIPRSAEPLALLPRDVVVAALPGGDFSLYVVRGGRAVKLAKQDPASEPSPVYLGWLR